MKVDAIYISPVKSLALQRVERARLGRWGIHEDRRFFLIDAEGRVLTQREFGPIVQVRADYRGAPESLRFDFPDGSSAEGGVATGEAVSGNFYGKELAGELAAGPWDGALSAYAGQELRLARATAMAFDVMPVSVCSVASVEGVRRRANGAAVDERRFRPNFYVSGVEAHGEDEWIGRRVGIGPEAVVLVRLRDPRCVITTHSPDGGETDLNTLKIIAGYRTDQPKEVNFGVYGTVEREGDVAVGDEIVLLEEEGPA